MSSVLLIKNMVCHRCVLTVEEFLKEEAIPYNNISIGEVQLTGELSAAQKNHLIARLEKVGFELIDDRMTALVEKIKQLVIKKARKQTFTGIKYQRAKLGDLSSGRKWVCRFNLLRYWPLSC